MKAARVPVSPWSVRPTDQDAPLRPWRPSATGPIARAIIRIFGRHGQRISNSRHLVGNLDLPLRDLVFLFPDEAFFAGDSANVGALNALITEPWRSLCRPA